jgi:LSD1 subclass zinc finger protein
MRQLSGGALLIGAANGYILNVPKRLIAGIMAFGSGVLISVLAFELMDEAYRVGGFDATANGFLSGAIVYTAVNYYLSHRGAKHGKRSGSQQPLESMQGGSGLTLVAGALLDGISESIIIGLSLLSGSECGCGDCRVLIQYSRGAFQVHPAFKTPVAMIRNRPLDGYYPDFRYIGTNRLHRISPFFQRRNRGNNRSCGWCNN